MGRTTLFLCGDVMPGRGVDQILPHPGDPRLREVQVRDARGYVRGAEAVNGRIGTPVGFGWPWGSALSVLDRVRPDVRVINLESAITRGGEFAPGKGVHYRMSPENAPFLSAGRPDVCVLSNNHVLDFGRRGLTDTLDALSAAGLRWAGAGRDDAEAGRPAVVPAGDRRVLVFACGVASSGIPARWAAKPHRPGVNFLPGPSEVTADALVGAMGPWVRRGDVVVVSVHWGGNWGYEVSEDEIEFAHRLIDGGVHVVHGHSSHHPRPVELYRGGLILYGCGDFIDDYEGIPGYEAYRDDLRVLYFADVRDGFVDELRMVVMQARRMRLHHAESDDVEWLRSMLSRVSEPFGTSVHSGPEDTLVVKAGPP
ncbi:CapA family protein [Saccharopolyspora taberi]|uniref:CapA family protein n=1 Tax=Saccharopolyspora taberi TaxID=60895 RepID=A0ABN3VDW0_9PSEU